MSFADLITRMKQFDKNAEVIFDSEEPIGLTTDQVMPRRRWFRRTAPQATATSNRTPVRAALIATHKLS